MNPLLGIAAVVGLAGYAYLASGPGNLTSVKSATDGREYLVQDLPDKQQASELMAQIHADLARLMKMYDQPEFSQDSAVQLLITRFNVDNVVENSVDSKYTSYSENKGEKIVLCLRDKKAPYPLVDKNTLLFVTLHEMGHLMTASNGHTSEFWSNFRRLLTDAQKIGIYSAVNYARTPAEYCGMMITDSPL
jgi:hypothetical protein